MLFRSMPSWTISHSGLMDTERKSSDKPANPIRTQLKTGSSWPHLPQSGHMVDTFLCCVVHLFFCGEPANTKPTKYKEAEKGWQKKLKDWTLLKMFASLQNHSTISKVMGADEKKGDRSWLRLRRSLIIRLALYRRSRIISETRVSVNSAHM